MPILQTNPKFMTLCRARVVWDGITRPEALEAKPGQAPGMKWNLKVVLEPNNPDLPALHQLAMQELAEGEFKGVLPNGGLLPIGTATAQEFNGHFPGFGVVNAATYRQPEIRDENGRVMQPHEYGSLLYNGQLVDLVVHCNTYNNKSKGIAARLDGIRILQSANAPRMDVGGGGFDLGSVWGDGGGQQQAPAQSQGQWGAPQGQPQQQAPAQSQGQWGAPQGQPQQQAPAQSQGQWGAPQGQPQQQAPAQGQWGAPQGQPQQQAPAPQQNSNWMPQ